jgi:hypothetical protein
VAGNQPRAALEGQVCPEPIQHHRDPIAETDQKADIAQRLSRLPESPDDGGGLLVLSQRPEDAEPTLGND